MELNHQRIRVTQKIRSLIRAAAERRAGFTLVPLVRFANGAEHREAREQCSLEPPPKDEAIGSARTACFPRDVICHAPIMFHKETL